jgi:tRNA(Ile)-lysidine synthase TilS/MesJ
MIIQNETIGYYSKKDFRSVVLESALKMFAEKARVKIFKLPAKTDKIAVAETLDTIGEKIIDFVINGKIQELKEKPVEGKEIKPLCLFLDKEVLLYAQLKKLSFNKLKENKSDISEFINKLEEKHPEIKNAIVKGYLDVFNTTART